MTHMTAAWGGEAEMADRTKSLVAEGLADRWRRLLRAALVVLVLAVMGLGARGGWTPSISQLKSHADRTAVSTSERHLR